MAQNKQLGWINDIKGFVIILVILYHSILNLKMMYGDMISSSFFFDTWLYFNSKLAPLRMPIFFFISGFLTISFMKRTPIKEMLKGKALNFLIIYLIWNIIVWAFISIIHYFYGDTLQSTNAVYAENLLSFIKSTTIANSSLWYLMALAYYYLFCKVFYKWPIFLIVFSLILNIFLNQYLILDWYIESVGRNLLYFVIGLILGKEIINLVCNNKKYSLVISSFLIIFSILFKGEWQVLSDLSFCLFFLSIFINFEKLISKIGFRKLGQNTLLIYVSHRVFVEVCMIATLMLILENNSNFAKNLIFLTYPILTCVISVIFAMYFKQYKGSKIHDFLLSPILSIKQKEIRT